MSKSIQNRECDHPAARLLPWLVAGTASQEEEARAQMHLSECAVCRADAQRERQIRALVLEESAVEHAPQPGLSRLLARLDEAPREAAAPSRRGRAVRWLAAAVVVQAVGLIALGAFVWQGSEQLLAPRFATLSAAPPSMAGAPRIRAVFAPSMTVGDLKTLLGSVSASVVAGPSEAGVYTLALRDPQAPAGQSLARLRAHAGVLFAEPQVARD